MKQIFITADGKSFDDHKEAFLHEEKLNKELAKDANPETYNNKAPEIKPGKPYLYVEFGKHGWTTHLINTNGELQKVCWKIIKERLEYGYYFDNKKLAVEAIIRDNNQSYAYDFLNSQQDCEYEQCILYPMNQDDDNIWYSME